MANGESSGVAVSYTELSGLCAEAFSFVDLVDKQVSEPEPLVILLSACLGRLAAACDVYETRLREAGVDVTGSSRHVGELS